MKHVLRTKLETLFLPASWSRMGEPSYMSPTFSSIDVFVTPRILSQLIDSSAICFQPWKNPSPLSSIRSIPSVSSVSESLFPFLHLFHSFLHLSSTVCSKFSLEWRLVNTFPVTLIRSISIFLLLLFQSLRQSIKKTLLFRHDLSY